MKTNALQRREVLNPQPRTINRLTLANSTAPDSPFTPDATPFFDRCEDGLMSLHFGGRMGLVDLFGWQVTDVWTKDLKYLTYVRPAFSEGSATAGYLSDPCADPNGFEFGAADLTISGFGRYGRKGPVREIMKATRYCETDPIYRLDGTPVTNETEWDLAFATDVLAQDIYRHVITGNSSTPGQFDGLQRWIKTGYSSAILDSMVVDWNGNSMAGTGGGTVSFNGSNLAANPDLIDMILAIYRRMKQRIKWSPQLARQQMRAGDQVLVGPSFLLNCILDQFTCWKVCTSSATDTYEARQFRETLNGGLYGAGYITLDGDVIHLFPYDWETMHGSDRGDLYFLTLGVGSVRAWQGEHLSATAAIASLGGGADGQGYFTLDGGRLLGKTNVDNLCRETNVWMAPRLFCRAPWLQARIMEVECSPILNPLSPDPLESSFYPITSFAADRQVVG